MGMNNITVNFHAGTVGEDDNIIVTVDRKTCGPKIILLGINDGSYGGLTIFLNQKSLGRIQDAILFDRLKNPRSIEEDAGITKVQANDSLDAFTEAVVSTLKKGDTVTLVGFGTFSVSQRAARNGRNPQTGATIKIKAKKVAKFKAGKELASRV